MTEELREQELVAIYRPLKARGNVWLAYSRKSPGFSFLNWNTDQTPGGVSIYLAVRPPLPPISALRSGEPVESSRARREFPENVHFRQDASESRGPSGAWSDLRRPSLSSDIEKRPTQSPRSPEPTSRPRSEAVLSTQKDHADRPSHAGEAESTAMVTMDPRLRRRPSQGAIVPPQDYVHPSRRAQVEGQTHPSGQSPSIPPTQSARGVRDEQPPTGVNDLQELDSMDLTPDVPAQSNALQHHVGNSTPMPVTADAGTKLLMEYFEKLKMSVRVLSNLGGGGEDASADNFYLHFPKDQEARAEHSLMEKWLKAHDVMVWADWGKFLKNCKRGIVIVWSL